MPLQLSGPKAPGGSGVHSTDPPELPRHLPDHPELCLLGFKASHTWRSIKNRKLGRRKAWQLLLDGSRNILAGTEGDSLLSAADASLDVSSGTLDLEPKEEQSRMGSMNKAGSSGHFSKQMTRSGWLVRRMT